DITQHTTSTLDTHHFDTTQTLRHTTSTPLEHGTRPAHRLALVECCPGAVARVIVRSGQCAGKLRGRQIPARATWGRERERCLLDRPGRRPCRGAGEVV